MEWEQTTDTDTKLVWERGDATAEIVARKTAGGEWAVHYDRLIQAPEGETYRHETVPDREHATELAAEWQASE
ncbi:DUF7543 family protein [Halosegnis longus]|uniref:DUF7543 family protein n=1 Tax=Halosegnis longus TaxID=2216012 RepID=UPI00129EB1CA|nr:hypothetical protein [Halosegnis longus]